MTIYYKQAKLLWRGTSDACIYVELAIDRCYSRIL